MGYITNLAIAATLSLPLQRLEIALRVAGQGFPNCQSYHSDGTVSACLPTFAMRRSSSVNGSSLAGRIIFSSAATSQLNENEFALLAGHEIAHYYLGHKESTPANEYAADRLGAELACNAGYNPMAGATLFRYLRPSRNHPSRELRTTAVLALGCRNRI